MFKSMHLKNFKAYKDSGDVPFAPLTIIVGANNSGKSTLFHALLAMVQTTRDPDQSFAPRFVTKGIVDLNGFHDIVHGRNSTKSSSFEISVTLDDYLTRRPNSDDHNGRSIEIDPPNRADVSFGLNEDLGEISMNRSTLWRDEEKVISAEKKGDIWSMITSMPNVPKNAELELRSVFPCISLSGIDRPSEGFLKSARSASTVARYWIMAFARQVIHIGPIRPRVPWHAGIGARTSSEFGLSGENLIADLASKAKDPESKKTRLELVKEWLEKRETLKRVRVEVDKNTNGGMLVGDEWHGPKNINIAAMGEGVSQILHILAISLFGIKHSCLLVEQPEIHLHPALQAELGDLFIDVAQTGDRQILVETHSEHLLLRVRRRIAEGSLKPEQVAILFVEKDGGESTVRRLDLNSRGHFSDWPKGFFDEAYQEAMALATAASKKG